MSKQFLVIKTTITNDTTIVEKDLHSEAFVNFIYNIEKERNDRKGTGSRVVAKANGYKVFYTVDGERWSTEYEIVAVDNTDDNKCKELLKDVEKFIIDSVTIKNVLSYFMANGREYCIAKDKNHIEMIYSYVDLYNAQHTFVKKTIVDHQAPFNVEVVRFLHMDKVNFTFLQCDNDRLELLKMFNKVLTDNQVVHRVHSDKEYMFMIDLNVSDMSKACLLLEKVINDNTYLTLLHKTPVENINLVDYNYDRFIMLFGK